MKKNLRTIFFLICITGTGFAQKQPHDELTFVRIQYNMGDFAFGFYNRYGGINSWQVDYPDAEEHFMRAVRHQTQIKTAENALSFALTDKELFDFAFAYIVEVGYLQLQDDEAKALREWLLRGGFLLIDDFHGPREWANFYQQITMVFPDRSIREIPMDHAIFHCYYDFDYFPVVPGLASLVRGSLHEKGGRQAICRGIFDDDGRLMVMINHNVDLGDSWEHANDYRYDPRFSILGYKLGINYLIYALTH